MESEKFSILATGGGSVGGVAIVLVAETGLPGLGV